MPPTTLSMLAPGRPPTRQEQRSLAHSLSSGGLVLLPTETVYGIAARADSETALAALAAIKGRPTEAAFTWHLGSTEGYPGDLPKDLALPGITRRLVADFWPGPLTLVMATGMPELDLIKRDGRVGMRAPYHAFTSELLASLDFPVVLSSANAHGTPPATDVAAALQSLGSIDRHDKGELAFIVDSGPTSSAQAHRASSVLLLEPGRLELVREGLLSIDELRRSAGLKIGFACTGNTCRSPMAEALARRATGLMLKADPANFGFGFSSMGLAAYPGSPASQHAIQTMADMGIDLAEHRSNSAQLESVLALDRIYTMTRSHQAGLVRALGELEQERQAKAPQIELFDPGGNDISDPFGGRLGDYACAATDIQAAIAARLGEWL